MANALQQYYTAKNLYIKIAGFKDVPGQMETLEKIHTEAAISDILSNLSRVIKMLNDIDVTELEKTYPDNIKVFIKNITDMKENSYAMQKHVEDVKNNVKKPKAVAKSSNQPTKPKSESTYKPQTKPEVTEGFMTLKKYKQLYEL